jgi:hypothetical protein
MKNLLLLIAIGLAAYGGYLVWNDHREAASPPNVAETKTEEIASPLKEQPTPGPAPPKAAPGVPMPVAPIKRLAPPGVFYTVQAFPVTTDSGVRGIRAGTPVRLIKDSGGTLRVTDGQQEFDAKREYLTNDLDIASRVAAQQASQQAAMAEMQQKQKAVAAMNGQQKATDTAASQQRAQENAESARAAADQRAQRMAEIRAQIAREEAAKADVPTIKFGASMHQQHLNAQNEKIRLLQLELGKLGVAGAALERK